MALFSRKNLRTQNPYGITEDDLKGELQCFPMGVVVRMMEEQELQSNKPDITVFQRNIRAYRLIGGFDWRETDAGGDFWFNVITKKNWWLFYEQYPEYARIQSGLKLYEKITFKF